MSHHHDASGCHAESACPFCTLWTAFKHSEAAQHLRNIESETLLLARSVLSACIRASEEHIAPRSAPEKPQEPQA